MEDVVRIKVISDMAQLEKDLAKINSNFQELSKIIDKTTLSMDKGITKSMKSLESTLNTVNKSFGELTGKSKQFQANMNLLGLGFFGMQIQRTFQGILTSGVETFLGLAAGTSLITDNMAQLNASFNYFKFLLGSTLLDVLEPFINIGIKLLTWFSNLSDSNKTVIVAIMAFITVIGFLMYQINFWALGIQTLIGYLGAPLLGTIAAAGAAILVLAYQGYVLSKMWKDSEVIVNSLNEALKNGLTQEELSKVVAEAQKLWDKLSAIEQIFRGFNALIGNMVFDVIAMAKNIGTVTSAAFKAVINSIVDLINESINLVGKLIKSLVDMVASGLEAIGFDSWADSIRRGIRDLGESELVIKPYADVDWSNVKKEILKNEAQALTDSFEYGGIASFKARYGPLSDDKKAVEELYAAYDTLGLTASAQLKKIEDALLGVGTNSKVVADTINTLESEGLIDMYNAYIKLGYSVDSARKEIEKFVASQKDIRNMQNIFPLEIESIKTVGTSTKYQSAITGSSDAMSYDEWVKQYSTPESKTVVNNSIYINNIDSSTSTKAIFGPEGEDMFNKLQKMFDNTFGSNSINTDSRS